MANPTFPSGISNNKLGGTNVVHTSCGNQCYVYADYSIWCPVDNTWVTPDQTGVAGTNGSQFDQAVGE